MGQPIYLEMCIATISSVLPLKSLAIFLQCLSWIAGEEGLCWAFVRPLLDWDALALDYWLEMNLGQSHRYFSIGQKDRNRNFPKSESFSEELGTSMVNCVNYFSMKVPYSLVR